MTTICACICLVVIVVVAIWEARRADEVWLCHRCGRVVTGKRGRTACPVCCEPKPED